MGSVLSCDPCRNTQCWRDCNQGCIFCCGSSCDSVCCAGGCCAGFSLANCCDCQNAECNPCLLREHSNEYLVQVLNEFEFKAHYDDKWFQEISLIEHKLGKELIVLKIVEETDGGAQRNLIDIFNKRLQIEHPNLIQLRRVINKEVDTFCSLLHKNYLFFDYIMQDLESLINFRQEKSIFFKEDELFLILSHTIAGLIYLLKNHGINHNCLRTNKIYQSTPDLYKISDPALFDDKTFYQELFLDRDMEIQGVYLSPNELNALRKGEEHPIHNKEKTDVFMLGMIMLNVGSLSSVDSCYDYHHGLLFLDKIQQKLEIIKAKYHDSLFYIIRDMLTEKESERPNLEQIQERLAKNPRVKQNRNVQNMTQTQFKSMAMTQNNQQQVVQSMAINDKTILPQTLDNPAISRVQGLGETQIMGGDLQFGQQQQNQQQQNNNNITNNNNFDQYQLDPQIQEILNRPSGVDYGANMNFGAGNLSSMNNYNNNDYGLGSLGGLGGIGGLGGGLGSSNIGGLGGGFSSGLNLGSGGGLGLGNYGGIGLGSSSAGNLYSGAYSKSGGNLYANNKTTIGANKKGYITFEDDDEDDGQGFNKKAGSGQNGFVTEVYNNGSKYEGQMKNGQREGKGKYLYANGGAYDGYWKNNQMHGQGVLYFKDGSAAYDGRFINNQMHGHGILYNEFPDKNQQEINPKDLQNACQDRWTKYEGDFNQGQKKGFGNLFFGNGEKYVGGFINNSPHGQGTFYYKDGRPKLQGIWKNGIFQN